MNLPKWAPWAVLGYFMLKGQKKAAAASSPATTARKPAAAPPAKPATAYLYQLPADGFDTTRVAFAPSGARPREMGIFGTPAKALELVKSKGWRLAWSGVRQLAKVPEGVQGARR